MHERIYQLLVEQNEISWKSIIYDLIRKEQMDPWDVDISMLAKRYVERLHEFKAMDLKISGKVLFAAALLLRIKSVRLVGDDLNEFDRLLAGAETGGDQFYDGLEQELIQGEREAINYELMPRLPQARKRKVSVYDLVHALEKALEVKYRRVLHNVPPQIPMPVKGIDIGSAILKLFSKIKSFFTHSKRLAFSELLPSQSKKDKIYTFIPLLHLSHQQKIELAQDQPFGEIFITPASPSESEQDGTNTV